MDRIVDGAVVLAAGLLTAIVVWFPASPVGTGVAGPSWLIWALPFLWSVPLWWRRRHPVLVLGVVVGVLATQSLVSADSPEGYELILVFSVAIYSAGAYATLTRAMVGLALAVLGFTIYGSANHDLASGQPGQLWAGAFFAIELLACWLAGAVVRQMRERRAQIAREKASERLAQQAIADERARLARDLHDIVSHNLSVVVVQAAGARAQGHSDEATLAKIENSGRESLVEMRRLLGVLRSQDGMSGTESTPRLTDIDALAERARDAGLSVDVDRPEDATGLSAATELTTYRVVQEALANAVRHAGPGSRVVVTVQVAADVIRVSVIDDGHGAGTVPAEPGGHGLLGMMERVTLMGGRLHSGHTSDGGYELRVELPTGRTS